MLFKSVKFAKAALAAIMFFTGLLVASCGNPDQDSQQKSDSASGTVSSSNTDMKKDKILLLNIYLTKYQTI